MLSPETIEMYRRMTLAERLALTFECLRDAGPHLVAGPPEVVDRRFELIRRQNDERNANILAGLARLRKKNAGPLQDP